MRKFFVIITALCMAFMLAACGAEAQESPAQTDSQAENQPVQTTSEAAADVEITEETEPEEAPADVTESSEAEAEAAPEEQDTKILVAYFSCTGNTRGLAEKIAEKLGADVYEITPAEPYTDADLDYNDSSSRSTTEQNDDGCRPEISGSFDVSGYDTIVLGYPIWWGQAPKILYTFVESCDLSGKVIVPFCTSSSSGVGSSSDNLGKSANASDWHDGTRLSTSISDGDLDEWLVENGLM